MDRRKRQEPEPSGRLVVPPRLPPTAVGLATLPPPGPPGRRRARRWLLPQHPLMESALYILPGALVAWLAPWPLLRYAALVPTLLGTGAAATWLFRCGLPRLVQRVRSGRPRTHGIPGRAPV